MLNTRTRLILVCAVLGIVFVAISHASADIPRKTNYQGRLIDSTTGQPLAGTHDMVFRIYTAPVGGSVLWSEPQTVVADSSGVVSAVLGSNTAIDISFQGQRWLEVEVDGEILSPRTEMVSSPYAFLAANSDSLGGLHSSSFSLVSHNHDADYVNEGQANSVTSGMVVADFVSSVDGVTNDAGDIDLIPGANITITPNDTNNTITISATGGGGGDVTDVNGGSGLTADAPGGPQVTLHVGPGDGIDVEEDAVSVDVTDFAGAGIGEDVSNNLTVNPGTGLEVSGDAVQLTSAHSSGSAYDSRFVNEGQGNSVSMAMVVPNIVSSVDGVINDGGNIDLVAGSNISITPDDAGNRITIAATGATGDVTDVFGGNGLTDLNPGGPQVTIHLGGGDGLDVSANEVKVDVTDFAGNGLGEDASNNLQVNTTTGLQISGDAIGLTSAYSGGSAYDSRFVNEGQSNSISSGMIVDGAVASADLASNSVTSAKIASGGVTQSDVSGGYVDLSSSQTVGGSKTFSTSVDVNATVYGDKFYISDAGNHNAVNVRNTSSSYPAIWAANQGGAEAIYGEMSSSTYKAIYARNTNSSGTGLSGTGNNATGAYLTNGSGVAATGTGTGLYAKATQSGNDGQEAIYSALGTGDYARLCYRSTSGSQYKVHGTGSASTVMHTSSGSVSLICPESPEAWIEDFGSAEVKSGFCHVELDPLFLECVTVDGENPLKVFVQLTSPMKEDFFVDKGESGFDVVVMTDTPEDTNASFDYRVVGKWRGWEGVRFEQADDPEIEIRDASVGLSEAEGN